MQNVVWWGHLAALAPQAAFPVLLSIHGGTEQSLGQAARRVVGLMGQDKQEHPGERDTCCWAAAALRPWCDGGKAEIWEAARNGWGTGKGGCWNHQLQPWRRLGLQPPSNSPRFSPFPILSLFFHVLKMCLLFLLSLSVVVGGERLVFWF